MADHTEADMGPTRWAVFDLDGVFTGSDTFRTLALRQFRAQPERVLRLPAALLQSAAIGGPLVAAAQCAVGGLGLAEYRALADQVAADMARSPKVIPEAVTSVQDHLSRGDSVLVATASEVFLAQRFLSYLGLDDIEVLGSHLALPLGLLKPHNSGEQKVRSLIRRTGSVRWDHVYTDSRSDIPLLRGGRTRSLVNARPAEVRRIERQLGGRVTPINWPEVGKA